MKRIAVIGINYNVYMGMTRLINKLRISMANSNISFFQCGSSGWELYNRILELNVDKIIVLDQFEGEEGHHDQLNYLRINDKILIVGIDPIYFAQRTLEPELKKQLEQITFQVKRAITQEISLDSIAHV